MPDEKKIFEIVGEGVVEKNNSEILRQFVGQKIAVICVRYNYRGVLSEVGNNYIILSNACAVEVTGPSNSNAPSTEDAIGGSIIINLDAIEIAFQPKWAFHNLPGES